MSSEALNQRFVYIPKSALIASICLHLAPVLVFLTAIGLQKLGIQIFPKKPKVMEIYQDYIQVDVVALPDQLMNDRTSVDPTLEAVDDPKTAEIPAAKEEEAKDKLEVPDENAIAEQKKKEETKKKEEAKKKAEEKEKRRAEKDKALKELKEQASREAALKALKEKGTKQGRAKVAGNILSKGTSMTGMIGSAKDRYTALIRQKIRENFNIFPWQRKKNLEAVVYIEIGANGRLRDKKLMKPSRDQAYDLAVLQAVEAAQPFPQPDDPSMLDGGVMLEFKPEE